MINSLEDLKKLFELCRLNHVTTIDVAGVKAAFAYEVTAPVFTDDGDGEIPGELKGDDLIFYSATRPPEMEG